MLVFMQAAGNVSIRVAGGKFDSVQFDPVNMGSCTIHTLTSTEITISGASQQFLWAVDVQVVPPLSGGQITATTDASSELQFSELPFGGEMHVFPGNTNPVVVQQFPDGP
jgi:hypothetical protein